MLNSIKKYSCFIPPILWAVLIFILCSISLDTLPRVEGMLKGAFDKIIHLTLYLVFTLFLVVSFLKQSFNGLFRRSSVRYALIISVVYGVLIELFQVTMLDGRSGDIQDVIANTLGSFFGLIAFRLIYGKPKHYF